MAVVDAHTHIHDVDWIPANVRLAWARQAAGRSVRRRDPADILPRVMRGQSDPDAALTIAAFDRAGVDAGVVPMVDWSMVVDPPGGHVPMGEQHALMADLASARAGRIWWLAGIDPRRPDAEADLDAAVGAAGCVGLKLYPAHGWVLDDPTHDWLLAAAFERDLPVMVHTSPLGGDPLVTPLSRPSAVIGSVARRPTMTWVFGHAGFEAWWLEACDLAAGWQNVYLDLSMWQKLARRDVGELRRRVAVLRERVGAHRLLWGSDTLRGSVTDPDGAQLAWWLDCFRSLAEPAGGSPPVLSAEELELAVGGNAERLYRLSPAATQVREHE